jgi:protein phosphatase
MPARCPADVSQWHAASERGLRRLNADATAVHSGDGRTAYVVADGVGDTEAAARAARVAAQVAARTAVTEGPVAAILAAQQAVEDGDCVLVVAVPDGLQCDIAWVGDCRAYHSNGRVLQQITVDHTVAEYYRARNGHVEPRMEHLVTTSVRTVEPERIGTSRASLAGGRLLLCSDGAHRSLTDTEIRTVIDQPTSPAWAAGQLVSTALTNGASDNATALVIDLVLEEMTEAEAA